MVHWRWPGRVGDGARVRRDCLRREIRTNAEVARIDVSDDSATGITLATGEQIAARAVVSGADPKRTLLGLLDPVHLAPDFVQRVQHIRAHGTLAKVNYAVSTLPAFNGLSNATQAHGRPRSRAAFASRATSTGSSARSTPRNTAASPTNPGSSSHPVDRRSIARASRTARGFGVRPVRAVSTQRRMGRRRDRLGDAATRTIERYAPGFASTIVAQEIITPLDLERTYGLTGGHIFHASWRSISCFVARPLLEWARYSTPIRQLYLCSSGTHPAPASAAAPAPWPHGRSHVISSVKGLIRKTSGPPVLILT